MTGLMRIIKTPTDCTSVNPEHNLPLPPVFDNVQHRFVTDLALGLLSPSKEQGEASRASVCMWKRFRWTLHSTSSAPQKAHFWGN